MLLRRQRAKAAPVSIETRRLVLVGITPKLIAAETEGLLELGRGLEAKITRDWPPEHWEPHVRTHMLAQFAAHPESVGWHRYALLRGFPMLLVGCLGAFPCAAGDVEIGYSVVTSYQRQGIGTEAALAFVEWLLEQPSIRSVSAQTYESLPESIKVMQRCGMRWIGEGDEPGTVRYRRWR